MVKASAACTKHRLRRTCGCECAARSVPASKLRWTRIRRQPALCRGTGTVCPGAHTTCVSGSIVHTPLMRRRFISLQGKPYALFGTCLGAIVAYEVARRVAERKHAPMPVRRTKGTAHMIEPIPVLHCLWRTRSPGTLRCGSRHHAGAGGGTAALRCPPECHSLATVASACKPVLKLVQTERMLPKS